MHQGCMHLWSIKDVKEFLSPGNIDARYVVVSVDPAGGGYQSHTSA